VYGDESVELLIQLDRPCLNIAQLRLFTLREINELEEFITSQPSEITEFDENLVRKLLAKVMVYEDKLVFEFKSGVSVEIEK
jgi:hypothetical protein